MVNQQLVYYIQSTIAKGYSTNQIYNYLVQQGYNPTEVSEAIRMTNNPSFPSPTGFSQQSSPQSSSKSVFFPTAIIGVLLIAILGGGLFFFNSFKEKVAGNELQGGEMLSPGRDTKSTSPNQMVDCKKDLQCFIDSINSDKLVKVSYSFTVDLFGTKLTTTTYMEIKKYDGNQGLLYIRQVDSNAEYAEGTPAEMIEQSNKMYKALNGKDGTCNFGKTELISMLNRWKTGSFNHDDWASADCTGDYFEWSQI